MLAEALLYLDLLVFLAGTLLYGYLARELAFRPGVLPGNRALRGVAWALLVFYGGTLVDQQLFLLVGPRLHSALGTALDLVRGVAWLLVFPLLAATLGHSARRFGLLPARRRAGPATRALTRLPWLSLALLLPALFRFAQAGEPVLAQATRSAYPWVVLHAVLGLGVSAYLARRLAAHLREERAMGRLLLGLQALLLGLLIFFLTSLAFDPWGSGDGAFVVGGSGLRLTVRTAVMAALLLPGLLFAVFVRRYNVLRLSLSFRTLRHFFWVLVLVLVLMLAGPALGVADVEVYRRVVAWGLLVAVFAGAFYAPVVDALLRRSPALRQIFGRTFSASRLEALLDRLQGLDLPPAGLLAEAARELGEELSIHADFLDADDPVAAPFWRHFSDTPASHSCIGTLHMIVKMAIRVQPHA
ncbi:MAG: hypothetical protein MI919_06100 [Holophagales bacterium]|nr:hypothetical protein [Holophagales bacterium]